MRKLVPLLCVLAAIAAILWVALGTRDAAEPEREATALAKDGEPRREEVAQPADVAEPERTTLVAPDEPSRAAEAGGAGARAALNRGTATLVVHVVRETNGEPLANATLSVWGETPDGGQQRTFEERVRELNGGAPVSAGADGRLELVVPAEVAFEGHVFLAARSPVISHRDPLGSAPVHVAPLAPGERRELRVEVPHGFDLVVWGRLVAAEDDGPLAGVAVPAPGRGEVVTGADGRFRLLTSSLAPGRVTVAPDGFCPVLVSLGPGHERPERALEIRLERAARLVVTVRGGPERGLGGLGVELRARDYALQAMEAHGSSRPLLLGEGWRVSLDEAGRATFDPLPPRVPFVARILEGVDRSAATLRLIEGELVLEPGETRSVEWDLAGSARVAGRVVDQDGRAVSCELWLLPEPSVREPGARRALFDFERDRTVARTDSDAGGAFVFEDVHPGWLWVGVGARDSFDRSKGPLVTPDAELIEVRAAAAVRVDLAVHRGLTIEGVVLAPDRSRGVQAPVHARGTAGSTFVWTATDPEGRFRLGPLWPGEYELNVSSPLAGYGPSQPVRVRAGARDVEILMGQEVVLRGRATGLVEVHGSLSFTLAERGGGFVAGRLPVEPDGTFALDGLGAGTYDLTLRGPGGRVGTAFGLEVGAPGLSDVEVALEPGGRVEVRYDGAVSNGYYAVYVGDTRVASDGLSAGTTTSVPVPPGSVRVELRAGDAFAARDVDVAVGETRAVRFDLR